MTYVLIGLLLSCLTWALVERRACHQAQDLASKRLEYAVKMGQKLLAERHGGTERAQKMARDFCRYNPPEYVIASVLGDEALG